jgi:hypothetical protein
VREDHIVSILAEGGGCEKDQGENTSHVRKSISRGAREEPASASL